MTELRALCRGILCCLAATACGGDGPPSLTGGRRVVHLLDHLDTLATVEGEIERPLPAPMEVSLDEGEVLADRVEFELPWPALGASELRVVAGRVLAPAAPGALLGAGEFCWQPALHRLGPGDESDFRGRQTRDSVHGAARFLFRDQDHVEFPLYLVGEAATLRLGVRSESGASAELCLLLDGGPLATKTLSPGAQEDWMVPVPARRGSATLRLEVSAQDQGPRGRLVASLGGVAVQRALRDRLQVPLGNSAVTVHYSGRLPEEHMVLRPSPSRPGVVALRSPGGPLELDGDWEYAQRDGTELRTARDPGTPDRIPDLPEGLWWFHGVGEQLVVDCPGARRWPWLLDAESREADDLVTRPIPGTALADRAGRLARRLTCDGDVRAGLWLPAPTRVVFDLVAHPGDRLRFSVGLADAGPAVFGDEVQDGEPEVSVHWHAQDGGVGTEIRARGGGWQDAELDLGGHPGPGRLVLESRGTDRDHARPLAVAGLRLVPREVARERPNVLLYVVDTLRASRLHCYGGAETSPFLDRLAAEGFLFEDFRAVASWTRPSMATVMTGLYPNYHGILGDDRALPRDLVTLPELMRAAGYSTWGAVANVQLGAPGMGFDQGFHRFVTPWGLGIQDPQVQVEPSSRLLRECLLPWMEALQDEPFFAWWHSMDPHIPYLPQDAYLDQYAAGYDGPLAGVPLVGVGEVWSRIQQLGDADFEYLRQVYDAEIRGQDDELGLLWEWLQRTGLAEDTILVVLSDHGEEFLEHDGLTHAGRMWEELLAVPLVVWIPERWRQPGWTPRRISTPVSQVDLISGLLELLGVEDAAPRQGESFLHLLAGEGDERPLLSYETAALGALTYQGWKLLWMPPEGEDAAQGEALEWRLYHLTADPREQEDLADRQPEQLQRMQRLREQVEQAARRGGLLAPREGRPVILDDETIRQLKALGYLGADD